MVYSRTIAASQKIVDSQDVVDILVMDDIQKIIDNNEDFE